ncbi:MAG TPA: SUF system Fe-S cluster assembly regulator [Gammaproteobacteria bacterium]|nr:SUF system Fe-S cluster assembly regulator [Gammaproteobacteria bacterium]
MLRISKLADYATLIMTRLARETDKLSSASSLARSLQLSVPVVSKILKILCQAGLISSARGADGGYKLARLATEISLAEVIAAIEGEMAVTECCSKLSTCALEETCGTKNHWKAINSAIYSALSGVTLQDVAIKSQ